MNFLRGSHFNYSTLRHKDRKKKTASQSPKEEAARKTTFGIVYNFILFWIRFHQLKRNDHYLTQNFRTCNYLFRTSFSYENSVCIPFSVSMKIHNALAVQIQNSTEQIPITNVCIQTFKSKSKPSDNIKWINENWTQTDIDTLCDEWVS